jgi:rubredoxin
MGSGEPVETLEGASFTCPVCGLGQERGDVCRECGLIFDKYFKRNAAPAVEDWPFIAAVTPTQQEMPKGGTAQ